MEKEIIGSHANGLDFIRAAQGFLETPTRHAKFIELAEEISHKSIKAIQTKIEAKLKTKTS